MWSNWSANSVPLIPNPRPLTLKLTALLKPPTGVTVIV